MKKHKRKRRIIVLLSLLIVLVLCRTEIYNCFVHYKVMGYRSNQTNCNALPPEKLSELELAQTLTTLEDVQQLVAKVMSFSSKNPATSPEELLAFGYGNCIAYARVITAIINCRLGDEYEARQAIAKLYFLGFDLHQLFKSPFFKDHDIVIVYDKQTGEEIALDPSLYDYTGIRRVHLKK